MSLRLYSIGSHGGQMNGWHIIRLLGIVTVVAFLVVSFTPLPNALNRWAGVSARLQPAAAIVVLGAGMEGDGVLSTSSLRRAIHGIMLFQRGLAPLLAFSGPMSRPHSREEAEVRAEMARLLGVSSRGDPDRDDSPDNPRRSGAHGGLAAAQGRVYDPPRHQLRAYGPVATALRECRFYGAARAC